VFSFAASSALARQIEASGGADIFLSADTDWMDYLDKKGLIAPGSRANLLGNHLVLVAPADDKTALTIAAHFDLLSALHGGRLAVADPASVPAGKYAKAALTALAPARSAGDLQAAGFIITAEQSVALGNKAGMFAYHRATNANYQLTVRTSDGTGSGWAAADHPDWSQLDFKAVSDRAIEKAKLSRTPVAIEPGRYTVIFEPQAVGDLVQLIGNYSDARSADEGRSPFVKPGGGNKVGEKIVDERVTIVADPQDPQLMSQPFDGDGLALNRQVFIENGVLKQLFYTRFWAKKQGKVATGQPASIKMMGGTTSVEDMIKSTERGVLVTRLWYLREVDPRTILYTGLTRDGTFLIENGKVTKAVRNFRFNDSPLFMLNNLEMLGPSVRLAGTEQGGDIVMPTIKVKDFNFTSLSEAV